MSETFAPPIRSTPDWQAFHRLGWNAFPLPPRAKRPDAPWGRWQEERSTPENHRQWQAAGFNAAIVTGAISGLVVLDCDTPEAVAEALRRGVGGAPRVDTARGAHFYFRHPGGRVANKVNIMPGMDLRGDGGFVVASGSTHPTGVTYRSHGESPSELPPMPDWLRQALSPEALPPAKTPVASGSTAYGLAALEGELATMRSAPDGTRNDQLNKSAFALAQLAAANEIDETDAKTRLAQAAMDTGLDADEIEPTLASGWNSGSAAPRLSAMGAQAADFSRYSQIAATPFPWVNATTIPPRDWMYGRWLLRGTVAALIAPGGVGKSSFMAGTALSLASGRSILGKDVRGGPKRVWLWNLEDDGTELARQISAAASHHAITPEMCADSLFVNSAMDGMGLCTAVEDRSGFRIIEPVFDAVLTELRRREIDVLIIDPFVSSHKVDENSNARIDAIAKQWARVAQQASCAIILVHHSRKLGGNKVDAEAARGAGALVNAARSVLVLNRMDANTAVRLRVSEEDRRRYFSVEDDKHNRAPPEAADWFRLVSVPLHNGGFDGGDNVGVVEHWTPPDPMATIDAETVRKVQQAIAVGEWRENVQAADWAGRAIAGAVGLNADDPADRRQLSAMLKQWIADGVLHIERRRDARRKFCPFIVVGRPAEEELRHLPEWSGAKPGSGVDPPPNHCATTTPL